VRSQSWILHSALKCASAAHNCLFTHQFNEMDRKEFLGLLGLSVGGAVVVSCLHSCAKDSDVTPGGNGGNTGGGGATKVDFTLDLADQSNAALNTNGGFLVKNGVIVAKTTGGVFIAVAAACTHQGTTITYQGNNQQFRCPNHGSTFSETGSVTMGPASSALKQYKTELSGNNLRVFAG
jgi:cytochrome b6-f complex iron-sulfur subunit